MRHPSSPYSSFSSALLILQAFSPVHSYDCKELVRGGATWNLGDLAGERHLSNVRHRGGGIHNTTFKIDICDELKFKDGPEREACGKGSTHICGSDKVGDGDTVFFPIVQSNLHEGVNLGYKVQRLKSETNSKEGVRLDIGGGKFEDKTQNAVIDFICIRTDESNSKDDAESKKQRRDDEKEDDGNEDEDGGDKDDKDDDWAALKKVRDGKGGTLEFKDYDTKTLRLEWRTPYGCEDAVNKQTPSSGGWGFFSWFFFLLFLGVLGYFAFSMWINYSRYGAQGWDLLPHSDFIRDLPYIMGDWGRKIVGTFTGGGSRGGYSAV